MDILKDWISIIGSILTFLGILFIIYKSFADPDIKAENRLDILENTCIIKHKNLFETINKMEEHMALIEGNHLSHIQDDISKLKDDVGDIKGDIKAICAVLKIKQQ